MPLLFKILRNVVIPALFGRRRRVNLQLVPRLSFVSQNLITAKPENECICLWMFLYVSMHVYCYHKMNHLSVHCSIDNSPCSGPSSENMEKEIVDHDAKGEVCE